MRENYTKLAPHLVLAFQKLLLLIPIALQVIAMISLLKLLDTQWGHAWSVENPLPLLFDLFLLPFVVFGQLLHVLLVGVSYIIGQLVYQNDANDHARTRSGHRRTWAIFMLIGGPIIQSVYYCMEILPRPIPKPKFS
jgi:hypothetical protein